MFNKFEKEINREREIYEKISIFLKDVPENVALNDLDADWNGRFISTTCMIKTITDTAPVPVIAIYVCEECNTTHTVLMGSSEKLEVPSRCMNCGHKKLIFDSDSSEYKNYAYMKLEVPLELRSNTKTKSFKAYMEDYLATSHHNISAGDVCNVTGWFRVKPSKVKGILEFIIEVHNILPIGKDLEENNITKQDKEEILELSRGPNVFKKFVRSIAPEMYGYELVKQGLVLQLFEGLRPTDNDKVIYNEDRWTIHILLIGDPGIGKSKLSGGVSNHAPKSITTNGAGASKVGLLSSLNKDELGTWVTEAGAIVLADSGLLIIDEFDKLPPDAQTGLNEPMEQLVVSSAKAGIVQTLTSRTSVLALANPKYSRFNDVESMKKQLDIVESTLSRFDLVFAVRDIPNIERDRKLAHNILNKKFKERLESDDIIPETLFKKYINYAKSNVFPELNQEANDYLEDIYVQVRLEADDDNKPITMRDLLAIQRLTIARAKVELREEATLSDAQEAVNIYVKSLESIGLDLTSAGEMQSVLSPHEVKLIKDVEVRIKDLFDTFGTHIDKEDKEELMLEIEVRCGSIRTKLTADEVFKEAYDNVLRNYHE